MSLPTTWIALTKGAIPFVVAESHPGVNYGKFLRGYLPKGASEDTHIITVRTKALLDFPEAMATWDAGPERTTQRS